MTALRSVAAVSTRPTRKAGRRWGAVAVFLVLLAVLFTAYLRLSKTYAENSDQANILLMASDLAHGNLYLSGWTVSDVPFITTELPEIAVLVRLFGLHLNTAHIAAALTYTVVVATALLTAAGKHGRHPVIRMAIVLAIMLAPQPGVGVFVLLFSVGHIGTAAPVMLTWLVLDWCWPRGDPGAPAPRGAWYLPAVAGLLLAWALMADPLVLVIAVGPLLVVMAARAAAGPGAVIKNGGGLRQAGAALAGRWLELILAAAAVAAYLAAWCGRRLLHAAGGYTQQPVPFRLAPVSTWYAHSLVVAHGLLEMFGAFCVPGNAVNYLSPGNYVAAPPLTGIAEAVAVTRVACVAVAVLAALVTARGFFRRDADLVSQLLLAGIVVNLAAYIPSSLADHTALNAREFAPVLPFAAVLAARTLGDRLGDRLRARPAPARPAPAGQPPHSAGPAGHRQASGWRVLAGALAALLCWYGFGLFEEARMPAAADPFSKLEAYLTAHQLRYGIGGYWEASVITVGTSGAVTVRAVTQGCLQPYAWESKAVWYDPAGHDATFLLTSARPGYFSQWLASPAALRRLAAVRPPAVAATLNPGAGYQVGIYRDNLLAELPALADC
jgi:cbb3-type cytochrome oxidase subunit 3